MANKYVKLGRNKKAAERERVLKLLTNEMTDLKKNTLKIIYDGADFDELGYMDGKDPETGEIVPLLVGLQPSEDGSFSIYPIARFYLGQDIPAFEPPDGRGNYVSRSIDGAYHNAAPEEESGQAERIDQE